MPTLKDRKLQIDWEKGVLYFDHCKKLKFLSSECKEFERIEHNLKGAEGKELSDAKFECISRMRFK